MFGKKVHVHGELAKKEVHPPQVKLKKQEICCKPAVDADVPSSYNIAIGLHALSCPPAPRLQHAPTNLNYAAVAKEELHDVAQHPPHINLLGGQTGVEEWDKVGRLWATTKQSPRWGRVGTGNEVSH